MTKDRKHDATAPERKNHRQANRQEPLPHPACDQAQ
jgi:hypothetical protein